MYEEVVRKVKEASDKATTLELSYAEVHFLWDFMVLGPEVKSTFFKRFEEILLSRARIMDEVHKDSF